jgi:adenylate cyclase
MKARVQVLVFALLLGAVASAVSIVMFLIPNDDVPLFHRVTDLVVHLTMLDHTNLLGVGSPWYDTEPNDKLGIITIDEDSMQGNPAIGLPGFPFPRSIYGKLLSRLKAAGAKTVAFDIDFEEPSADPAQDAAFAAGMRALPTVLAYTTNTSTTGHIGIDEVAPDLLPAAAATGFSTVDFPGHYFIGQPFEISTGASGQNANQHLYSLAAAAVQTYTGTPIAPGSVPTTDGRLLLVAPTLFTHQDAKTKIVTVEEHTAQFAGAGVLSFADALTEPIASLRTFANGRLIYAGATAQGLGDFVQSARQPNMPGLFANARLADQLMRGIYIRTAPNALVVVLLILFPLLVALALTYLRPTIGIGLSFVATLAYAYLNLWLFVTKLIWIDLLHVAISMILATMLIASYRVLFEGAQKRMVTEMFGMHVSPAIVSDILKQDDPRGALALRGKRVKATIFYSDIRGFTAMSETMTPEEIYAQLNEYFEEMCAIIFKHGGYVDKFIGDCVMAVFSAPYQTPDDARNAVIAAVEQQDKIIELGKKWEAQGKKVFTVGMGVNTGDVVMGNLGSSSRMNYTVIGDNVNVAARLYNVAKGGEIIISDATYEEVRDIVEVEPREAVSVKGKSQPLPIYNVTRLKSTAQTPNPASV